MALKIGTVEPTAIKVVQNGTTTDLTILEATQNGTTTVVWGKPFSLIYTAGSNSTISVSRTSSPNQHASIGALSSGATVYYGDVLSITATPNSGYKITSFTINGTEYGNEQTSAVTQLITVTSAVNVASTTSSASAWHTVWTGSSIFGSFKWLNSASGNKTQTVVNGSPTGVDWSLPTRITGTAKASAGGLLGTSTTKTITALELVDGTSYVLVTHSTGSGTVIGNAVALSIKRTASTPNAVLTGSLSRISGTDMWTTQLTLTKVEQYY